MRLSSLPLYYRASTKFFIIPSGKLVLQQENSSATRIKLNFHSSFKILGSHRKLFLNLIEGADNSNANKPRISQTPDNKRLHSLPNQAMLSFSTYRNIIIFFLKTSFVTFFYLLNHYLQVFLIILLLLCNK